MSNLADKIYTMEELRSIITPIAKVHKVRKVYLFGSYGRGLAGEQSDIDLRIDAPAMRNLFQLGGLYADLEDALGKKVDIVTNGALANPINRDVVKSFAEHIKEDERLIYEEE